MKDLALAPDTTLERRQPSLEGAPLERDEVHVWTANLAVDPKCLQELASLLSPDESARAGRFVFDRDRRRYVAARGLLRQLLGRYTGRTAADVRFSYGSHGKPSLDTALGEEDLFFNVSHSRDIAVFAFSRGIELGCDVEAIDREIDVEEIAHAFFTPSEIEIIMAAQANRRQEIFFEFWTKKEAVVKGEGQGLSIPLTAVEVAADSRTSESWQRCNVADRNWWLQGCQSAPGYVAAIACARQPGKLSGFVWTE